MKRKLIKIWSALSTLGMLLLSLLSPLQTVSASQLNPTTTAGEASIRRDGCKRVIEKVEEVKWEMPRQPVDLVILQDASGSFAGTVDSVKQALIDVTTPVTEAQYDENNPRLVFTNDPNTTDRVMFKTYRGADVSIHYKDDNFTIPEDRKPSNVQDVRFAYNYDGTGLTNNAATVRRAIRDFTVEGLTPTVPAIDQILADYAAAKANDTVQRKTVFLLITDGVANGFRTADGKIAMEISSSRLQTLGGLSPVASGNYRTNEFAHNYTKRAEELKEAGNRLKAAVGNNGRVVVGFWESLPAFSAYKISGNDYYLNDHAKLGEVSGSTDSVRKVFGEALQSVPSPDENRNGRDVTYYVHEQNDVNAFSRKVLASVAAALSKENVSGDFEVTEGYTVEAVRINGKTVVENVTDENTQVKGKVIQEEGSNKVTITVPESVFNPGNNKFEYDLKGATKEETVSEDDESDPSDDYAPTNKKIVVPQLSGSFKVGNYPAATIGGKPATEVEVQEILYCYPSVTKSIKDGDSGNDTGLVSPDPLGVSKKDAYAANLTAADEGFTYTIDYRFNNSPYEWKENAMLVDPLDYRLEVVEAKVEDTSGLGLTYTVQRMTEQDTNGNDRTVLYAHIPKVAGKTAEDKGPYDGLVFKTARLVVKVKLKPQYQKQGTKDYTALLQDSGGYGLLNQGSIMWNGSDKPNEDEHAAKPPGKSTIRRSNAVYVKPPLATEIEKKVNEKEHEDLKTPNEEFTYTVTTPWPGPVDSFKLEDTVVPELEIVDGSVDVKIGGNSYSTRGVVPNADYAATNKITIDLNDKEAIKRINTLVLARNRNNPDQPVDMVLTFKAKIRPNADLSKYTKNGVIKVPNTADVTLNGDKPITSNEVTVTPPKPTEPEIKKTINGSLTEFVTYEGMPYTYNIVTAIPNTLASYSKFVIKDTLDSNLEVAGDVVFAGEGITDLFDIKVEGQVVTASVKAGKFEEVAKLSNVELIIPAKVKAGVTVKKIDNTASIDYTNDKGEDKDKESDPVTVTPPSPSKKINETLDHLDIENEGRYVYNIKVTLPTDIKDYKKFVISDTLDNQLSFFPGEAASMKGDAANFFKVVSEGQTVTATITDFAAAAAFAGKEVELIIPARINAGVTTAKIPNVAKVTFTDSKNVDGEKDTNPVTVTPPSETPEPKKTVDTKESLALDTMNQEFTYDVKVTVPENISGFTKFELTDDLVDILTITSTIFEAGTVTSPVDANAASGKVVASIPVEKLAEFAGKEVTLTIKAKIKDGTTAEALKPFLNADGAIPNKANLSVGDKPGQNKDSNEVPVTPPSEDPTVEKKINKTETHLDTATETNYNYNITTKLPLDITAYKKFVITDELDQDLAIQGTPVITGDAARFFDVKVEGQVVTATMKDFANAGELATKDVELVITAQIRKGVTRQEIPNTAKVTYTNKSGNDGEKETKPVTVTPPGEDPTVEKKINGTLEHLDTLNEAPYTYNITAKLPVDITSYKKFVISDEVNGEIAVAGANVLGDAAKFFDVKVDGQTVTATMKDIKDAKALAGKTVELVITAHIKPGVTTAKIPNTAKITYQNKSHVDGEPDSTQETPPVTVTPPPLTKKINDTLDTLDIENKKDYNYNIKTVVPGNIAKYKSYVIVDTLDKDLEPQSAKIVGDAAQYFDVKVEGQVVTATIKDFKAAAAIAGQEVELVIVSQIREGVTRQNIPNTAKITFSNTPIVDGEEDPDGETPPKDTPPTPPVTVTPPGENPTVEKKINGTLEHLDTLNEAPYTYNITAKLPVDITSYKKFVISDEVNGEIAVAGANVLGDAAKFFDVTVDGQTVTATMKDIKDAKALAGKPVELVITAHIKPGVTTVKIPNTAKITYQNKSHVDGEPDSTQETPPVTVTPPPLTKKINDTLDTLDIENKKDYNYNIKTVVPGNIAKYKSYVIVDTLDKDLEPQSAKIVGDAAQYFDVKVEGQKVTATIKDFKAAAAIAGQEVELVIVSQIREGVTRQNIPNTAKITFSNTPIVDGEEDPDGETPPKDTPPTPPVTVTPPGENPTVEKKINGTLEHLDTLNEAPYTYNITAKLPVDITSYKKFVISDEVNGEIAVAGANVLGDAAKFFDVTVDGQTVTATMKDIKDAKALAGKPVELVITAHIKPGVTTAKIPNTAKITYQNKSHVDGEPDSTQETPPVTVTPPPLTKKINDTLDTLDIENKKDYNYNIKTVVPGNIAKYKSYVIVDTLDKDLEPQSAKIVGDAAQYFDVKVEGQKVTATIKDFKAAAAIAGQEVELVIVSQIREGVTRQNIPNTAKITFSNTPIVDGEEDPDGETPPKDTPPTPPVTVTPPGENPTVEKKINKTATHLDTHTGVDYTYNITTVLPVDITSYKKFVIVDELDSDLEVQGTPVIVGDAAKFFDVKVDGQTVTATMKDFKDAKAFAGKPVELIITSQIRAGVTRQAIPNTAKVTYQNKSHADGTPDSETPPTPPVTVTPPPLTKKINQTLTHLDVAHETDYTYNIKTVVPGNITNYKSFVIVDELDKDLDPKSAEMVGAAAAYFDVKIEGQVVTATIKDFKAAAAIAGQEVELVIVSQIREGVSREKIPNTTKITYNNNPFVNGEEDPNGTTPPKETPPTPPVTVTPPTPNTPPITKKVNGADRADLKARQEVFTYTIDTTVPTASFAFEVTDTLEPVLTFDGAVKATLSGQLIPAEQVRIDGQTVTVTLTSAQVKKYAGEPVQVTFNAKVKDGADLRPYMADGVTSVPNTASYVVNNNPATKKDSNTVPVVPPTPEEPGIDKKINRDLTHLDIAVNQSYIYNVYATIPADIATYKEFILTDTLESVLAINGNVVAYVDGYTTDAIQVSVDGNKVTATVVDFAKLAGFKQIQLYIPAYIKADADLTPYLTDGATRIPNTAGLDFTDSNGVKKRKDTLPVTVTPPTPTPPVPPTPREPDPGAPKKTVSRVPGVEQKGENDPLRLTDASEDFRFDIISVVPADEADDKRFDLVSVTFTDTLDDLFAIKPNGVAIKVSGDQAAGANYIDEDVAKAQAVYDEAVAQLTAIQGSSDSDALQAAATEAQAAVTEAQAAVTEAQAKLDELKVPQYEDDPNSTTTPPAQILVDKSAEIEAQEKVVAELEAKLAEAQAAVTEAQAALAKAKTPAEVAVEAANQQKVVDAAKKVLDEATAKQAKVNAKAALLTQVNDKGELTADAIAALGGTITVNGQDVTVDFTDEDTMEALKGRSVTVIIYASIKDVNALKDPHFTDGIHNVAHVDYGHKNGRRFKKKTNPVTVIPPRKVTPPTPPTPPTPGGDLPPQPTPTPKEVPVLPRTGVAYTAFLETAGFLLGLASLGFYLVWKNRKDA